MTDTSKIVGATTEHWMDKRLRLKLPIDDPTNVIRINAAALLAMNNEKNRRAGTKTSLYEASKETVLE